MNFFYYILFLSFIRYLILISLPVYVHFSSLYFLSRAFIRSYFSHFLVFFCLIFIYVSQSSYTTSIPSLSFSFSPCLLLQIHPLQPCTSSVFHLISFFTLPSSTLSPFNITVSPPSSYSSLPLVTSSSPYSCSGPSPLHPSTSNPLLPLTLSGSPVDSQKYTNCQYSGDLQIDPFNSPTRYSSHTHLERLNFPTAFHDLASICRGHKRSHTNCHYNHYLHTFFTLIRVYVGYSPGPFT
ncbi:hypothetical protein E2C01_092544 [Portunus trituberculatus]|uniref:Uncharacterized protein n=1 Tax=Portunus trituberculatus TaxID=210409 RepID=A0A5B7JKI6_PORTR|nr:hypothetical protein [Portunus trituberculatus]